MRSGAEEELRWRLEAAEADVYRLQKCVIRDKHGALVTQGAFNALEERYYGYLTVIAEAQKCLLEILQTKRLVSETEARAAITEIELSLRGIGGALPSEMLYRIVPVSDTGLDPCNLPDDWAVRFGFEMSGDGGATWRRVTATDPLPPEVVSRGEAYARSAMQTMFDDLRKGAGL